jgi:hypothetical protein
MRKDGKSICWSLLFLSGAIGLFLSGAIGCSPVPDADTGVNGICQQVWVHRLLENPNPPAPYPDVTISLHSLTTGKVLYQGKTDPAGGFRIQARSGKYRLVVTTEKPKDLEGIDLRWDGRRGDEPGMGDVIEVTPGKFTKVEIMVRRGS